ncbi:MAG: PHP domain-containing protein [Anaerolineae bacterium]|nr:PHP domain-containing protein [Anaerolineae bacterium]
MHERFENRLTTRDCKRHISHHFTVPGGSDRLVIDLEYEPALVRGVHNLVTLTLFDPLGFRGAGHRGGARQRVRIEADAATPGYLPGPVLAGVWTVQVDTHMVMPGTPLTYRLDVRALGPGEIGPALPDGCAEIPLVARPDVAKVEGGAPCTTAGWYRGDFHTHTHHSDAADFSVSDLIAEAQAFDLDFVFLTDHNTVSGLPEMDAAESGDLLTAGGMELTTFWGHALVLGTREWVDWRISPEDGRMAFTAAAALANRDVFVIAHPQADSDPGCTGCAWRFGEMMPGNARVVEVWNGLWDCDSNNARALELYYDWLNQGYHVVASAGTDVHGPAPAGVRPGFSVVYAMALTERAILDALLAGHLYLSSGPIVTFTAIDEGGFSWMMGDVATRPVTLHVTWEACPGGAEVRVLANGRLLQRRVAGGAGEATWAMALSEADWVIVEIRAADGALLALTNPIYFT